MSCCKVMPYLPLIRDYKILLLLTAVRSSNSTIFSSFIEFCIFSAGAKAKVLSKLTRRVSLLDMIPISMYLTNLINYIQFKIVFRNINKKWQTDKCQRSDGQWWQGKSIDSIQNGIQQHSKENFTMIFISLTSSIPPYFKKICFCLDVKNNILIWLIMVPCVSLDRRW